jgi:hypothetical protein
MDMPQVDRISASLRFSKEMPGGGAWKSVELGAEAGLEEGETYEEGMAALYTMLAEDMRRAFGAKGPPALPAPETGGNAGEQSANRQ